jgi:hypothetical protein
MNYIDILFEFPIVLYNNTDLEKAYIKEVEKEEPISKIEHAIGFVSLPVDEIVGFMSSWKSGYRVEEIKENKELMSCTSVITRTMGSILCSWKYDKFRTRYQEHLDKIGQYVVLDINDLDAKD